MESDKIKKTGDREKACSKCGAIFTCSIMDCWCDNLPAIMPMDGEGDCFCPACLEAIINAKIQGNSVG